MLKIAAIDVGSNALRLTVGEMDDSWQVKPIENVRVPVRLGQDVFTGGRLEEASMLKMEQAFQRFQRVIEDFGVYHLRAVATSAMREAANGPAAVERVFGASGIALQIIDGEEEARLVHLAVSNTLELDKKQAMLVDIGGGSVEVTLSTGDQIESTASYNIGAVRLLKLMEQDGGTRTGAEARVTEFIDPSMQQIEDSIGGRKIALCAGTGGNVEEIGRLRERFFKAAGNRFITMDELGRLIERLRGLSAAELVKEYHLRPDRADVILAGALVLQRIAGCAHVQQVEIPNVGLKDGLLLDIAAQIASEPKPERRQRLMESALHMGRKYQFDEPHARLSAKLARQVFTQAKPLHDLGEAELLLLEVAALLHDIGHFINTIDHDKHGYYLLKANQLTGLSDREQNIVAHLVLYHRGKNDSMKEDDYKALSKSDQQIMLKLAALLSLADGLDVSHTGRVQRSGLKKTSKGWLMKLPPDLLLEKWTVEKRKSLFEEVFGVALEVD